MDKSKFYYRSYYYYGHERRTLIIGANTVLLNEVITLEFLPEAEGMPELIHSSVLEIQRLLGNNFYSEDLPMHL